MKINEKINLTKQFKNEVEAIKKDESYEYRVIVSSTSKNVYGNNLDDQIINFHLEHISSDYKEDGNYDTVISNGYINEDMVIGEFLFRRLK